MCNCVAGNAEDKAITNKDEDEKRIAEMGRPVLGENSKLEIVIEESYEFKVLNASLLLLNVRVVAIVFNIGTDKFSLVHCHVYRGTDEGGWRKSERR